MKKLLSFILAMSMVFSLMPVFSASAEGEEAATAETISYVIKNTSISKEPFAGAHYVPLETEEGENFGKLKFTAANGTVTYANPTVFNVLTNLWSDFTSNTTSISVSKVFLTSYRELDYYQYTADLTASPVLWKPLRSFVKDYNTGNLKSLVVVSKWGIKGDENKTPITYKMPSVLDLSKTAPFEIMGVSNYSHAWLQNYGYEGAYIVGSNNTPTSFYDTYKNGTNEFNFALRIKIPEDAVAGKYTLRLGSDAAATGDADGYYTDKNASTNDVYVIKVPETGMEGLYDYNANCGLYGFTDSTGAQIDKSVYVNDDNFIGQFRAQGGKSTSYDKVFDVTPGEEYIIYFRMAANSITIDEETGIATNVYYRPDASQRYQNFRISYADLVPVVEEDEEYKASFDAKEETYDTHGKAIVNTYAYTDKGEQIEAIETAVEKTLGDTYTYTAPEQEGKNFLYWAKGASKDKMVISYTKELTYKPSEGQNYLIAVYEDKENATAKAEFYNANGDRLSASESVVFPDLPSLAGYGKAEGWNCYNNGMTYTGNETDIELSGTMIFVAKYKEVADEVTVEGKTTNYGELVTFAADVPEGKVFKGWKKNGEIVSTELTYSFYAWEDADVEPIYADETPNFGGKFIKILIDTFKAGDNTAIMAEFIGITDAVEKGIIVNDTQKIAMKGDGNQFTVTADVNGTYEGYAIVKDGTSFTQIKDGNIEVK